MRQTIDQKLCVLGQRNNPSTAALKEIINFHFAIGKQNVEDRVREINEHLKVNIGKSIPHATFVTPIAPELSGAIVIFNIPGVEPLDAFNKLYINHGIACAPVGAPTGGIRLSPNIHNTIADMDKIVDAIKSLS